MGPSADASPVLCAPPVCHVASEAIPFPMSVTPLKLFASDRAWDSKGERDTRRSARNSRWQGRVNFALNGAQLWDRRAGNWRVLYAELVNVSQRDDDAEPADKRGRAMADMVQASHRLTVETKGK